MVTPLQPSANEPEEVSGPPEAPAPPLAEVHEPAEVACRIGGKDWFENKLRLSVGGAPFASVTGAPATLVMPIQAKPSPAVAVMDDGNIVVRAVLSTDDIRLYAKQPVALLGILTPAARTVLDWISAAAGSVRVAVHTTDVLVTPDPVVDDLKCDRLSIVEADYDARKSITARKQLTKRSTKREGVPIAITRGGASVATFAQDIEVELLEIRGGQTRVLADQHDYLISGWVASADLGPAGLMGIGAGYGTGRGRYGAKMYSYYTRCPDEVELVVDTGSERARVGAIHKGTPFLIAPAAEGEDKGELRQVTLPQSPWIVLEKKGSWLVDSQTLATCHTDTSSY